MAYNRAKVIGIDAGMASTAEKGTMSSTHWEVQVVVELMISTCPDSSDGRALDM